MRDGQKVFCKRAEEMGSRLGSRKVCGTAKDIIFTERETQRDVEKSRRQNRQTG